MNKMRNKILQLNVSAKDKLLQLGIYTQTKQTSQGISSFEESMTSILSQSPIDAHSFLAFLIENSRKRFYDEIDSDMHQGAEIKLKLSESSSHSIIKAEMNATRGILQKGLSSFVSNKTTTEENKPREGFKGKSFESRTLPRKEFSKSSKSPLTLKSIDCRPSYDFRDEPKSGYDMSTSISRGVNLNGIKETTEFAGSVFPNEMESEHATPVKGSFMKEMKVKQESLTLGISLNNTNITSEKSLTLMTTISSRGSSVKKVKISSSNNKKSLCLEETTEVQSEKKEVKVNKETWLKNYDILKIEHQPLPVASKKETKKLLLEKVYNQLLGTNTDIKRTIKYYRTNYLTFKQRKQSESDVSKQVPMVLSSETSRPKSLTIQSSSNSIPTKAKVSNINPNQRSLISMENIKDMVHHSMSTDAFMNAVNPFYSNSMNISKQNKEFSQKKPSSQKFLILPKLNLNSESQSQGVFPSWPASLQNSKSIGKHQFPLEFATRPRYDRSTQKGPEKILHNLVIETKQEVLDFETTGSSLANPLKANRGYLNFSHKSSYPLGMQNFDSSASLHKHFGF